MPDVPFDATFVDKAIALFCAAADASTRRLAAIAAEEGLDRLREDRHLQPVFASCLRAVAADAEGADISPTLSHGLKGVWPRLGTLDVSVRVEGGDVMGELKCGIGAGKLDACAWDAAKLAFLLGHGVGAAGLLVACSDQVTWEEGEIGAELFDTAEWDMADIRERYDSGFRRWENDGYKPERVVRRVRTTALHETPPFDVAGTPWAIRLARVEPVGDELMDWPPLRSGSSSGEATTRASAGSARRPLPTSPNSGGLEPSVDPRSTASLLDAADDGGAGG